MVKLSLDVEEQKLLINLLENCLADLRMEISATDNFDYKLMLKSRKAILQKLLAAIQENEQEPLAA